MLNGSAERRESIRHTQNALLYRGVKYSAAGSLAAAVVAVYVLGPFSDSQFSIIAWFLLLVGVYLTRLWDTGEFHRATDAEQRTTHWKRRFNIGALSSSTAWASSVWLIYPVEDQAHQVLLVLMLGGVAAGALASLPYDRSLSNTFQGIIVASVLVRLVQDGGNFSIELAIFSLFVFGFLLSCGKEVGTNYFDLIRLRQDSQETNLTLIRTTERMAQLGYWQWHHGTRHLELSQHLRQMLGFNGQEIEISEFLACLHPDDRLKVEHICAQVVDTAEDAELEYRVVDTRSGVIRDMRQVLKLLTDSTGEQSLLGTVQDITDIKSAEQKIYSMAYYDELTGLANRAHFHERLDAEVALADRRGQRFAIVYIDLDDFKGVNDSYGHACGDAYLKNFAHYLASVIRRTDVTARLGGDEFCILLGDIADVDLVQRTAERCLDYCNQVVQIGNHRIHPRLSIGVAVYPDHGSDAETIVKSADMAMYTVKQHGKRGVAFYESRMASENQERVRLEADLREALAHGDFELWYQPKVDIRTLRMQGVEALIRWRHPERGMIPPDLFIHTAERVGMIREIGEWVFETACAQLVDWNRQGLRLNVAVNISGDHFVAKNFTPFIRSSVERHGVRPEDLEIEITESLSRDPGQHTAICHELRQLGVRVAIDDFGTGYSSLSVLGKLEVDTLKIDKSFIDGIEHDEGARLMVRSIVALSLGLGYDIVAEGVETHAQLAYLQSIDCPYVQGYFFSKPVQAGEIAAMATQGWTLPRAA